MAVLYISYEEVGSIDVNLNFICTYTVICQQHVLCCTYMFCGVQLYSTLAIDPLWEVYLKISGDLFYAKFNGFIYGSRKKK